MKTITCPNCAGSRLEGFGSEDPCSCCKGNGYIEDTWPETPDLITTPISGVY